MWHKRGTIIKEKVVSTNSAKPVVTHLVMTQDQFKEIMVAAFKEALREVLSEFTLPVSASPVVEKPIEATPKKQKKYVPMDKSSFVKETAKELDNIVPVEHNTGVSAETLSKLNDLIGDN